MAQQGERSGGGPPGSPPPRPPRAPPATTPRASSAAPTPGDVTPARNAPPPAPPPPATRRSTGIGTTPRTSVREPAPEKAVKDSAQSTPVRTSGASEATTPARAAPTTTPRASISGPGASTTRRGSTPDPGASKTPRASTTDPGASTTPRTNVPDSSAPSSLRASTAAPETRRTSTQATDPSSSPKKSDAGVLASQHITFEGAQPSTSAKSRSQDAKSKSQDAKSRSQDAKSGRQNTSASKKPSLWDRFQGKKKSATPENPQRRSAERRPQSLSGPSMLQNRAKTNRILYTTDEEVREALIEFSVFIIFLILTSLVVLSVRHSYMFYFNDTMKKLFTTREMVVAPSVTVSFEKLITVPDWWDYLIYNFLITLHGDMTFMDGNSADNSTDVPGEAKPPPVPGEEVPEEGSPDEDEEGEEPDDDEGRKIRQAPENAGEGSQDVGGDDKQPTRPHNTTGHHLEGRVFLYENLLLGPPRIRQIRVRKESCYVNDAFVRYFNTCYAAYSPGAEERTSNYKGSSYKTMSDLDTTPLWTTLAFYRTGGYTVELDYDKNKNLKTISHLKDIHWLDRGSRLCLVEFNLYNENTDIFQSVKLIAEIPPTGGVIPQAQLQTVKHYSFFTDRSMPMTVIYIFWYIMIIYYTIYEITELLKSGFKNYILSMLNILDCAILLCCYLALVYNIWHFFKINSVTDKAKVELTYQSLDILCFWNIIYVDMMAILAFLVWIKIFKFISFNKTLVQFTTTLKRCSKDLAGFSLMFGIVFLAYAQLGLLLFGTKHPDFRNFITSILTMIRMILGDFQYNLIEQANRVLGPIYFLTYILLVFFILLNMFLAIIMETYNSVKSEITQGRSHLGSYIYKKLANMLYWITHCGRKRRPQAPPPEVEEKDAVPEPVQEMPQETRKHMTPAEARFFQDVPAGENPDMVRLTNRVGLLEEILEKLITNMDDILKRVEKEKSKK